MSEINRPIPESYWVEPGRFLAGEYPGNTQGNSMSQRLDKFLDSGINSFIDLTDPGEMAPYLPLLLERAQYYGTEINYKRFSVTDHGIPIPDTMHVILDEIDVALENGRNVYVHCWGGIGRTGTTVGCYLVRHGLSGQQALDQLATWWQHVPKRQFWPRSPETNRQVQFIMDWNK